MADSHDRSSYDRDAARARLAKRQSSRATTSCNLNHHPRDARRTPPRSDSRRNVSQDSQHDQGRFRVVGGRGFDSRKAASPSGSSYSTSASAQGTVHSSLSNAISWAWDHPRLISLGLVVLVLAICIGFFANACAARQASKVNAAQQTAYEQQSQLVEGEINLPASLDPQIESTLKKKAQGNSDVDWIIRHASELSVDGDTVLKKLLKLTAKEDTAISFVRNFSEKYPQETGEPYDEKVKVGEVPLLQQWDERWGYTVYSSTAFALTGCCPTCMSMVYMGLTGQTDKTPYDMGVLADEMGYMDTYNGTVDTFLTEAASKLGLSVQKLSVSSSALSSALAQGKVVICNVGAGDFTDSGHYIVITSCDRDGMLTVNDPFSAVNSSATWDIDQVISQTKGLWAYSA